MADVLTKEQRRRCMQNIKSKDTKPEIKVRKYLFSEGFRFRLHDKRYPGRPDLVLPKYKTAIFINGCFWHQHPGCSKAVMPKTNTKFWSEKLNGNRERDKRNYKLLEEDGWNVIIIWECELQKDFNNIMKRVKNQILQNDSV